MMLSLFWELERVQIDCLHERKLRCLVIQPQGKGKY